jgi:hypothetical protein
MTMSDLLYIFVVWMHLVIEYNTFRRIVGYE